MSETIAVIIQARMSSTRLPGKVLMPLGGRPAIEWTLRAAKEIDPSATVMVATSAERSDDVIAAWCDDNAQPCFRGSLNDVLQRYYDAAEMCEADIVMRLTADCPLLDPAVCRNVLKLLQDTGADYASNVMERTWPKGLDCEAFTMSSLRRVQAEAHSAYDHEHVTPYFYQHPELFTLQNYPCPIPGLGTERWTLDTPEDYAFLQAVTKHLGARAREMPPSYARVLGILNSYPALRAINQPKSTGGACE